MTTSESELKAVSFPLGRIVMTANAVKSVWLTDAASALLRHARGDWGEIGEASRDENERGLAYGMRLLSVYHDRAGVAFWIITEADRRTTTVLLPADY